MTLRSYALAICLLAASTPCPSHAQEVRHERGTLHELIERLTSREYLLHHPSSDDRPYVRPEDALRFARRAAMLLAVGETQQSAAAAAQIGYELIEFFDRDSEQKYYLLREDLAGITQLRGWGAYLLNPNPTYNALVEAPHPLGDSETVPLAAEVFSGGARALLIAGAHRDKADLPDLPGSVFHQIHEAWVGSYSLVPVLQIHGFAAHKHDFPKNAQMVLSTGDGQVTNELLQLDKRFDKSGFPSYVYNQLDPSSPENLRVNGDTPGKRFRMLAATKNMQGRQAREIGGKFLHLEFEYGLRHDKQRRVEAARLISRTMAELAPAAALNTKLDSPPVVTVVKDKQRQRGKSRDQRKEG